MNVVHRWECSFPFNYKKWTIKTSDILLHHFANDEEILWIKKLIKSHITKIVMITLHIMKYHVRPTYCDSFNYTWAKVFDQLSAYHNFI